MTSKIEDATYLVLVERQIAELEERLFALKSLVARMAIEGADTSDQVELYANMSQALSAVDQLRMEAIALISDDAGRPVSLTKNDG